MAFVYTTTSGDEMRNRCEMALIDFQFGFSTHSNLISPVSPLTLDLPC